MSPSKDSTPYDSVYRTMLNDCTRLIIPVINEIFGEHFTGEEKLSFLPNEHFMNQQDGKTKEKITDNCLLIDAGIIWKFHIECESKTGGEQLFHIHWGNMSLR